MTLKNVCMVLILLAIAGSLEAKNMHKVFGTDDKTIKNSCKVGLYMIDMIPVMSVDQIQGENYVYDYRIIQSISLNKKAGTVFANAVLDTNQYVYGDAKRCPFMGKYALHFRQGKHSVTIVISVEPCEKVVIFCPGSVIDKKHIDLIAGSSLIAAFTGMFGVEKKK